MVDVTGIDKTYVYQTCLLRRNLIKIIQREVEKPNYAPQSSDLKNLNSLLALLNNELKQLSPKLTRRMSQ
jgi:hypothetical protein